MHPINMWPFYTLLLTNITYIAVPDQKTIRTTYASSAAETTCAGRSDSKLGYCRKEADCTTAGGTSDGICFSPLFHKCCRNVCEMDIPIKDHSINPTLTGVLSVGTEYEVSCEAGYYFTGNGGKGTTYKITCASWYRWKSDDGDCVIIDKCIGDPTVLAHSTIDSNWAGDDAMGTTLTNMCDESYISCPGAATTYTVMCSQTFLWEAEDVECVYYPAGYTEYVTGKYFKLFWMAGGWKTWSAAKDACAADNARLATIPDAQTATFIKSLIKMDADFKVNYWIGLNDLATEGTYAWDGTDQTTGTTGYEHWAMNEPGTSQESYDCVMFFGNDPNEAYEWYSTTCALTIGYICEYTKCLAS